MNDFSFLDKITVIKIAILSGGTKNVIAFMKQSSYGLIRDVVHQNVDDGSNKEGEGESERERPSTNRWLKTLATHGQPVHNTSSTLRRTRNGKTKIKHTLIAFYKSTDSGTVYRSFGS